MTVCVDGLVTVTACVVVTVMVTTAPEVTTVLELMVVLEADVDAIDDVVFEPAVKTLVELVTLELVMLRLIMLELVDVLEVAVTVALVAVDAAVVMFEEEVATAVLVAFADTEADTVVELTPRVGLLVAQLILSETGIEVA